MLQAYIRLLKQFCNNLLLGDHTRPSPPPPFLSEDGLSGRAVHSMPEHSCKLFEDVVVISGKSELGTKGNSLTYQEEVGALSYLVDQEHPNDELWCLCLLLNHAQLGIACNSLSEVRPSVANEIMLSYSSRQQMPICCLSEGCSVTRCMSVWHRSLALRTPHDDDSCNSASVESILHRRWDCVPLPPGFREEC